MDEPRIVSTKLTKSGVFAPPPEELVKRHQTAQRKVEAPATRLRVAPPRSKPTRRKERLAAIWGALLLAGGIGIWVVISKEGEPVPEAWQATSVEQGTEVGLKSGTRDAGPDQGNLLRLEWPPHPRAQGYVLRFMDRYGNGPAPLPVTGSVFLYDLESDVLRLPAEFEWEVTALLPDGSHVVTPRSRYSRPER